VIPPQNSIGANAPGAQPGHSAPASGDLSPGGPNPPNGSGGSTSPTGQSGGTHGSTGSPTNGSSRDAASDRQKAEQYRSTAKSIGQDDSLVLVALVLGFTFAVSGVVVAAGLRGGRRVR
jgi:hypothetical protein